MNVGQLIEELQQADPNMPVNLLVRDSDGDWIRFDDNIRTWSFRNASVFDIISIDGSLDTEDDEDE